VSDPASITIAVAGGVFGVALFTALAMSLQWLVQAMRPKKQERAASADPSQPSEPPTIGEPGATTSSPPGMQRATRAKAKGHSTIVQVWLKLVSLVRMSSTSPPAESAEAQEVAI
jgi:hypothetical protein